ncbi:hypothetical protein BKA62DRAFT_706021 [Auriculariales sp. MPI-PUGE-AT-0066]|nr:hypothetical protein BKA62DRAFT_706021 [Auriculariales sp. MPI-PUGE-AT-0066]
MSRLSYFQRTLPDDVPRPVHLPASPPETELSQVQHGAPMEQETAGGRFRRLASSVAYHHSANANLARDARPVGPRTSRWLVVVLPPQSLLHEPAALGHTLSTSPANRFNNGILMPLFPTMYGQLTAIAREFGLPSVSGVCIYLHMAEGGSSMAPRISDDTWNMLWGHLFDELAQPPTGLPYVVVFDIDARKARWYNAWIGAQRGEHIEYPIAGSVSGHQRHASRTTLLGDEDLRSENGLYPLHLQPAGRAVNRPRKLNLVQKPAEVQNKPPTPPSESAPSLKRLSPVAQEEEEPVTAKLVEVDRKIMQWRMTSGVSPNPLSNKTGQISLDPAHMPNSAPGTPGKPDMPTDGAGEDEDIELNLDDFAWSISSAGPPSYPNSPVWSERVESVHLDYRMRGSAPPTPSTATTGWPYNYPDSPVYSMASRVATPDIAYCLMDSRPCTPTTATSWGPASYQASMLAEDEDLQSLDLGHRFAHSRPVSPMTATSWGPGSYAATPRSEYYAASVHLGHRMLHSRPLTPMTATSWGPGSYPASPFIAEHIRTPGVEDIEFEHAPVQPRRLQMTGMAFPYYTPEAPSVQTWSHVWPYISSRSEHLEVPIAVHGQAASVQWQHVWPYASTVKEPMNTAQWQMVWPYHTTGVVRSAAVSVLLPGASATYPLTSSSIYPPVQLSRFPLPALLPGADGYPFVNGLYPSVTPTAVSVRLPASYPELNIYPVGYPLSLDSIYPATTSAVHSVHIVPASSYPSLTIYAPVYPYIDIYPAPAANQLTKPLPLPVDLAPLYPNLTIYRVSYPSLDIYPSVLPLVRDTFELIRLTPLVISRGAPYPMFDLYPGGYPHNLGYIYNSGPMEIKMDERLLGISITAERYPFASGVYTAVYPHNLDTIYTSVSVVDMPLTSFTIEAESYPFSIGIYVPVYPHLVIYRPTSVEMPSIVDVRAEAYPFVFGVYPAVYPHNLLSIYAPVSVPVEPRAFVTEAYPFDHGVYPAVYPYNLDAIYPSVRPVQSATVTCQTLRYPFLSGIYPAIYPYSLELIYEPVLSVSELKPVGRGEYPYFEIYASQYPHVSPFPPMAAANLAPREHARGHRRSITPPRGQVIRDLGKTHAARRSHSFRFSRAEAPPVPIIPAHIRSNSISPSNSRAGSPTNTIPEEPSTSRRTHKELHDSYFANLKVSHSRKSHAQLHDEYHDSQAKLMAKRALPELPKLDTVREGTAGSHKAAIQHSRRTSASIDKLMRQYSPDQAPASPMLTASGPSPGSGRPVSRLDRSKFPFA